MLAGIGKSSNKYANPVDVLEDFRDTKADDLWEAIKHGDEAHQAWLKDAIRAYFEGKKIPPVVMKEQENV
jgi:bacterioferritin (cytochrome b1)